MSWTCAIGRGIVVQLDRHDIAKQAKLAADQSAEGWSARWW
jgi:hypothetical protein